VHISRDKREYYCYYESDNIPDPKCQRSAGQQQQQQQQHDGSGVKLCVSGVQ